MSTALLNTIITRAKALLLKPAETWDLIAAEDQSVPEIYKTWVAPLAAILPIAALIGLAIIGGGFGGRVPFANALSFGVVWFVLTLAGVYAMAYVIDALAPYFDAPKDFKAAFKLAAYFPVAFWIAGVLWILPPLAFLWIVGLYSFYLLYVGLPKLMKPPPEKAGGFTLTAIGAAVIINAVVWVVASSMLTSGFDRRADARDSRVVSRDRDAGTAASTGKGGTTADTPEEALGAALGAMLGGGAAGGPVVQADALERLAPNRLVGLGRRSVDVEEAPPPFAGVQLNAEYGEPGEDRLTLTIINSPALPSMLPMLGLAEAVEEETDDGYMRVTEEDGDYFIEQWDGSSETGQFGRTIGGVFMVMVEGRGVSERDLQRAVNEFSERELERLPTTEE